MFATEHKLEPRSGPDPNQFFNQLYNLKQGTKPIAQYVAKAEDLYRKCSEALKAYMGNQFVTGIADEGELDMVHFYLSQEAESTFPRRRQHKAHECLCWDCDPNFMAEII